MTALSVTWVQALAWRMQRQLLDPVGEESVAATVGHLGAVAAFPDVAAELSVGARRRAARPGDVAAALVDRSIVTVYAFRGATHLMTPAGAAVYLPLRASSRMWELPSWQSHYGLAPDDWPAFRATVREALADGPLGRAQLAAAVTGQSRYRHLEAAFADRSDTLLKPLVWQGDMCFAPTSDGTAAYQRFEGIRGWSGTLDLPQAGPQAVTTYVSTYGPATAPSLQYWLGGGLGVARKAIRSWVDQLGDRIVEVDVDGVPALMLAEQVDDLVASRGRRVVRLLPAVDQWVMGPGTAAASVVPPERRSLVSHGANIVVAGGVVAGTWSARGDQLTVSWFEESGGLPRSALEEEAARTSALLGRPLELDVQVD